MISDQLESEALDLINFPKQAKKPMKGIWFGLTILNEKTDKEWNFDIWFVNRQNDFFDHDFNQKMAMLQRSSDK